jgi:hypothetical protein
MPIGRAMREAKRVTINVPKIALPMPPPSLPGAGGSWANRPGRIRLPPLKSTYANTKKRGSTAMTAKAPEMALNRTLNRLRAKLGSKKRLLCVATDGVDVE